MTQKRRNQNVRRLPLFFAVFLFSVSSAWADDSAYHGSGDTVVPINNDHIQMVSEIVRIRYDHKAMRFYVNCEFVFRNTGDDAEVLMGFPDSETTSGGIGSYTGKFAIRNFRTIIDKKLVRQHSRK